MEKFIVTPIKNSENEGGRRLMERNSPVASAEGMVTCKENLVEKRISTSSEQVTDKSLKIKKIKIKKGRGEKRKFPDKFDSFNKTKRKKKEEKLSGNVQNIKENREMEVLQSEKGLLPDLQCKKMTKKKGSPLAGNDSDVENGELVSKQRSSRKSKAIASTCKDALDILLKFDLDILNLLDKSLKIIKSHSFLDNKYISVDILIDLITLALEKNVGGDVDPEKELTFIIMKCVSALCTTPKRSKAGRNITTFSPKNNLNAQEDPSAVLPPSNGEIFNKSQDLEESMEKSEEDAAAKLPENRREEPRVEKSGKNFCITNYFKKLKKTVEERDKNERFSCFTAKTDMFLAPKLGGELTGVRREKFEEAFSAQNCESRYLTQFLGKSKRSKVMPVNGSQISGSVNGVKNSKEARSPGFGSCSAEVRKDPSEIANANKRVTLTRVDKPKVNHFEAVCRTKAKLFQFHDNRRPPYWGTWRRKSGSVRPRRPFGKDKIFNYEIDSDDEWEEEEEPGESLHGSDDEKEPEEDYEVDNEFFVPHGYLSDDENPEKENLGPKRKPTVFEEQFTSEPKQRMRKMTPIVFGTYWVHKGLPCEGTLYHDLQVERLQYVPWTSVPVEIEQEPTCTVKKSKRKVFPNEEIPNLIKMIHGSPRNSDHLARKFLLYWETEKPDGNRPGLTKICVQKKIKELAAWQAGHEKGKMCWQVPKETREEFGAEVEKKTPEKNPRKCFIWKFVRKAEKSPGMKNPPPPAPPLEPEVIILDS